jgi:cytochrome P450
MILQSILVLFVVYLIWYIAFRRSDLPPGPPKLPLIGNGWWFILQKIRKVRVPVALCEIAKKYGDVIHFQVGNKNIVFLQGFDVIDEAFVNKADDFSSRPIREPIDNQKVENGIVMQNGKPHTVTQGFIMKFLNSEIAAVEEKILEEVDAATEFLKSETSGLFDVRSMMSMMMTNIIYNVMFNKR